MGTASQPFEISDSESEPTSKRARPDGKAVVDLTASAACARAGAGVDGEEDGGASSYIMIDLCDSDDESEACTGGGNPNRAFAQSLQLAFDVDGIEIDEDRSAPARGKARLDLGGRCSSGGSSSGSRSSSGGSGGAGSSAGPLVVDLDDESDVDDAVLAARLQAQLDEESAAEEKRRRSLSDADRDLALQLQARLNREIEESGEADGPPDVLRAQRNQIRTWLGKNAADLRVRDVKSNPHAEPGGALYARFAEAYAQAREREVRLVWHGTAEANIDTICREGLDPKKRGQHGQAHGAGEYFAETPSISLPYCAGGRRLLVFAVLMDKSGLTKRTGGILVVHKSSHQLPVFVVTFDNANQSLAGLSLPGPGLASRLPPSMVQRLTAMASRGGANSGVLAALRTQLGLAPPPPPARARPASGGRRKPPGGGRSRKRSR